MLGEAACGGSVAGNRLTRGESGVKVSGDFGGSDETLTTEARAQMIREIQVRGVSTRNEDLANGSHGNSVWSARSPGIGGGRRGVPVGVVLGLAGWVGRWQRLVQF